MHVLIFVMIQAQVTQMNEVRVLYVGWCMTQDTASTLVGHPFFAKHEITLPVRLGQQQPAEA
jgi:hypothetical protein